jgi:hypothetical protein
MTFEEIDARARELFSTENDASMWAYLDEGDRTHWRKMAIEELERPDRRFFGWMRNNTMPL